ncbi:MAG: cytochrome d ubiquinol oxidase subunit II [Chlamydiota bacterium]|nr:cytochrome d ubiquinol oxidase subunit II [Chlamydiota bacterium]
MNDLATLEFIWFTAFVVLISGYAILDGFDLGVGMLHLFSKDDTERRLMLNSIGPLWDGNEVWLVTAGGALFAGFPDAYATICSSFYLYIMIFLCGIMFRAVAIEFRSKQPMAWWRWMWDILFSLASLIIAGGLGLILGNLIRGLPLDSQHEFIGTIADLTRPYDFVVSILTVSLFLMHGSIFLLMKTEGDFHDKIRKYVNPTIIFFIMCYAFTTVATLIWYPHMIESIRERQIFFLVAIINMLAIANIPREINHGRDSRAFACSCLNILCLLTLFGIGTFPNIVRAINNPANSVTIYNAGSSVATLHILLIISAIGLPLVISYTFMIYYIFHGKVKLDSNSY